jgi:hypothetical protein
MILWAKLKFQNAFLLRPGSKIWIQFPIVNDFRHSSQTKIRTPYLAALCLSQDPVILHSCTQSRVHAVGSTVFLPVTQLQRVDCVWNVMAHAQEPDFVFRRNGRVHLNRRWRQFSWLLAAEMCASPVVMLDTPMFRGSVKGTGYPLHTPVSPSLPLPCVTVCHHVSLDSTGTLEVYNGLDLHAVWLPSGTWRVSF